MNYSYEIVKSRYGLYTSVFADGTRGTTALTEEACDFVTRNIRIPVMRGEWDGPTSTLGQAVVGRPWHNLHCSAWVVVVVVDLRPLHE